MYVSCITTLFAITYETKPRLQHQHQQVCLEFVSKNLSEVLRTEGYLHMTHSCPSLQSEILATIASAEPPRAGGGGGHERSSTRHATRARDASDAADADRRVRPRLGQE